MLVRYSQVLKRWSIHTQTQCFPSQLNCICRFTLYGTIDPVVWRLSNRIMLATSVSVSIVRFVCFSAISGLIADQTEGAGRRTLHFRSLAVCAVVNSWSQMVGLVIPLLWSRGGRGLAVIVRGLVG